MSLADHARARGHCARLHPPPWPSRHAWPLQCTQHCPTCSPAGDTRTCTQANTIAHAFMHSHAHATMPPRTRTAGMSTADPSRDCIEHLATQQEQTAPAQVHEAPSPSSPHDCACARTLDAAPAASLLLSGGITASAPAALAASPRQQLGAVLVHKAGRDVAALDERRQQPREGEARDAPDAIAAHAVCVRHGLRQGSAKAHQAAAAAAAAAQAQARAGTG